jgi:hypothetical protein
MGTIVSPCTEVTITAAGLDWDTAGITQPYDLVYAATGQKYNGPVGGGLTQHSIMHAMSSSTYGTLIWLSCTPEYDVRKP